jgi:glycine/D-amino acid oxidase-like deaminating enzyme
MELFSIAFYRSLHEAGHDIGYRNNGHIMLSLTPATAGRVEHVVTHPLARPGMRAVSPSEVAELTGVVDADMVRTAAFMPEGIQVETGLVAETLAREAADRGAEVRAATVQAFGRTGDRVTEVVTDNGAVPAAAVVVAAGAWTNEVLALLDARLALLPVVATRVVTQPLDVPPTMPTLHCPDFRIWMREKAGALTWGCHPYHVRYALADDEGTTPQPQSRPLLETNLAAFAGFERVIPRMREARVDSWMQGMPVFTPDENLMVGPLSPLDNVFVLTGDNESGVSHGPAMGRAASELVRGIAAFVDLHRSRLDRFAPDEFPDEESIATYMASRGKFLGGVEAAPGAAG